MLSTTYKIIDNCLLGNFVRNRPLEAVPDYAGELHLAANPTVGVDWSLIELFDVQTKHPAIPGLARGRGAGT
jgi:hypothetical protein